LAVEFQPQLMESFKVLCLYRYGIISIIPGYHKTASMDECNRYLVIFFLNCILSVGQSKFM